LIRDFNNSDHTVTIHGLLVTEQKAEPQIYWQLG